jgi:hypothetical protein
MLPMQIPGRVLKVAFSLMPSGSQSYSALTSLFTQGSPAPCWPRRRMPPGPVHAVLPGSVTGGHQRDLLGDKGAVLRRAWHRLGRVLGHLHHRVGRRGDRRRLLHWRGDCRVVPHLAPGVLERSRGMRRRGSSSCRGFSAGSSGNGPACVRSALLRMCTRAVSRATVCQLLARWSCAGGLWGSPQGLLARAAAACILKGKGCAHSCVRSG